MLAPAPGQVLKHPVCMQESADDVAVKFLRGADTGASSSPMRDERIDDLMQELIDAVDDLGKICGATGFWPAIPHRHAFSHNTFTNCLACPATAEHAGAFQQDKACKIFYGSDLPHVLMSPDQDCSPQKVHVAMLSYCCACSFKQVATIMALSPIAGCRCRLHWQAGLVALDGLGGLRDWRPNVRLAILPGPAHAAQA